MTDSHYHCEINRLENEMLIFCQNLWGLNPNQQIHINLE